MVRDARVPAKLGWLWMALELPPLDETQRKLLASLFEVRNEFVHHKWTGKDPEILGSPEPRLTAAVTDAYALVEYLREDELTLLEPHINVAEALFEIPIRDYMRHVYDEPPSALLT